MMRTAIKSSAIAKIGYDDTTQTLEVEYQPKDGAAAVWQYSPISEQVYFSFGQEGVSSGRLLGQIKKRVDSGEVRAQHIGAVYACSECGKTSEEFTEHQVCPTCEAAKADVA